LRWADEDRAGPTDRVDKATTTADGNQGRRG
jgi:hypothetical protein